MLFHFFHFPFIQRAAYGKSDKEIFGQEAMKSSLGKDSFLSNFHVVSMTSLYDLLVILF